VKNKGQTMMEILATYGWAILIIIVVVGALYAMGVFQGQTPEQITKQVDFCKNLCVQANLTYYSYGKEYCECKPEKENCIAIQNVEYCKDEGSSWIVKYMKKAG